MKGKTALIVPYFGEWPKWFDLFLLSCSKQLSLIDFYFFTDCGIPQTVYENTLFSQMSFNDYCEMVSKSLGITFQPASPYKLTDLKPFLGHVHKEIIGEYEFWAFGDIDLIYGDMSIVLSEKNLNKKDFITTHSERVAGHFSAVRVDSPMFDKCFCITDWRRKLEDNTHYGLDEGDYTNVVNPSVSIVLGLLRRIAGDVNDVKKRKICSVVWRLCPLLNRRVSFVEYYTTPIPDASSCYFYHIESGSMMEATIGRSLPYLHFLFFKKTPYLKTCLYWDEATYYTVEPASHIVEVTQKGIRSLV